MDSKNKLIIDALKIGNLCGLDMYKINCWTHFNRVLSFFLLLTMLSNCVFISVSNWKDSIEVISVTFGIVMILIKYVTSLKNKEKILALIKQTENFWPANKYGPEFQKEIEIWYGYGERLKQLMFWLLMFILIIFGMRPLLLRNGRTFPFQTFTNITESPKYEITYTYEIIFTISGCVITFAFETLFVAFIISIICQFKLLKEGFTHLKLGSVSNPETEKRELKQLNELIAHHNLILECVDLMQEIYGTTFLNIFMCNMLNSSFSLMGIITAEDTSPQALSVYVILLSLLVSQLSFYCVPGSILIEESEGVANAVYSIDWWIKTQPALRKVCSIIIQRVNKPAMLTAGELFPVDLDTFATILKKTSTFVTFMRSVYSNDKNM